MEPIIERLDAFIKHKNYSYNSFSSELGYASSEKINRLFRVEGAKPSYDILHDIANKFVNELDITWLITGHGNMINENSSALSDPENKYSITNVSKLKTDRKAVLQQVPLYELKATAGIVDLLGENNRSKHIPISYISIPNLPKCDGAIPITGDSMYPLLKSGDMVLYREVQDKSLIIWGEMYLVAITYNGDDYFFAKYIQKAKREGWIKLISQNVNHQEIEFPIDSVTGLAIIKASIRINTQF